MGHTFIDRGRTNYIGGTELVLFSIPADFLRNIYFPDLAAPKMEGKQAARTFLNWCLPDLFGMGNSRIRSKPLIPVALIFYKVSIYFN